MEQKKSKSVLQDMAAKFCAYLVRPHFLLYLVLGILFAILARILGVQLIEETKPWIFVFIIPLAVLTQIFQREFCSHFYKEKYRVLVPYNPLGIGSPGIPGIDKSFYETITGDIGLSRKIA